MGKSNQATTRELVVLAMLSAAGGGAVAGLALLGRMQTGGLLGGVLLVIAALGALYAVMWVGGAAMFVFVDQLAKDPERTVGWSWRLTLVAAFLAIPITGLLLEFDRDQWIWGAGSAVVGLALVVLATSGGRRRKAG